MATSDIISSIKTNLTNAYTKLNEKGATIPTNKNIENLASAIETVTSGGGSATLQTKEITITENGTQSVIPDEGYDGLEKVDITTNVSGSGDVSEYFDTTISGTGERKSTGNWTNVLKKLPNGIIISGTNGSWFFAEMPLQTIPELDTSNITNMRNMFSNCKNLQTIPKLDTSKVTDMTEMLTNCSSLTSIPKLDTSNVTSMNSMFNYCKNLQTIPKLDTSKVTNMYQMFSTCSSLTSIPELDTSNVTSMYQMFFNCISLTSIPKLDTSKVTSMNGTFNYTTSLTTLGGFENFGQALPTTTNANNGNYTITLSYSTKLTHDSLVNVINNLYDIATKGCKTQKLVIGSTNIAKLTSEEIAIATTKGWTVS